MKQIRDVLRLGLELSLAQREISRITKISRDTVSAYLTRAAAAGLTWPLPPEMDDAALEQKLFPAEGQNKRPKCVQPEWKQVAVEARKKGATLLVLHLEYLQQHPDGMGYSLFCQRFREFQTTLRTWMRNDYIAGERAFVDFAGKTVTIHDMRSGTSHEAQIFVGALGASALAYAEAIWSQKIPDWVMAHVRMMEYFGGAPAVIVCDNLKAGVVKADRYAPVVHPAYEGMARHHGSEVIPARAAEPKDKSRAELTVGLVTRWILFRLRKRVFTDLAELNRAIAELLEELNNRKMQKLDVSRRQLYEVTDKLALRPLPAQRYSYADWFKVRVGMDYRVLLDEHRYSVPYTLANQEVELRVTADTVEVYYRNRRVTSHVRSHSAGTETVDPLHLDPNHRFYATWSQETELQWAANVGEPVHELLKAIFVNARFKEQGYRPSQRLRKLHRKYDAPRLIKACAFALQHRAIGLEFVEQVLRNRLEEKAQDPVSATETSPGADQANDAKHHSNIRGSQHYR